MFEQTIEGILDGFVAYANENVPGDYEFEVLYINQKAYQEFLKIVNIE